MRISGSKVILFATIIVWSGIGYLSFARRLFAPPNDVAELTTIIQRSAPDGTSLQLALFSPDDNIRKTLIALIDSEQKQILIAIFSLTDSKIVKSLLAAHKRGVKVEVVADRSNADKRWAKIHKLAQAGIAVYLYPREPDPENYSIMHHKFALFSEAADKRNILLTGSYNFTNSASDCNQENVLLVDDTTVIERYQKQFKVLKSRAKLTSAQTMRPAKKNKVRTSRICQD